MISNNDTSTITTNINGIGDTNNEYHLNHSDSNIENEPLLTNRYSYHHHTQSKQQHKDYEDSKPHKEEDGVRGLASASPISIDSSASSHHHQLKKNALGLVHCIAMSIGGIGPTCGIFLVSPQIARYAGANVPFSLILATFCCLSMASTISTFGKYIYSSASFYQYVSEGLGGLIGFISGWTMLLAYLGLSIQTIIQFSSWTSDIIRMNTGYALPWPIAGIVAILIISSLAYVGINPALKVSLILVIFETVITFVLTIVIVIKGGQEGNYPLAFTPAGEYSGGMSGMARSLVFSILVFVGFETAAVLGGETRNPKSSIPKAVVGSVLITAIWLVWGMYAIIVACGPSNAFNLYNVSAPMDLFARKYIGDWYAVFIDIAGMSTTFNVSTVSFNNMYRILYSIGKAKLDPVSSKLGITSRRFKTPVVAIIGFSIYHFIFMGVITAIFGYHTDGSWKAYNYLSYVATIPLIMVFIVSNIAVIPYMLNNHKHQFSWFFHLVLPIFSAILFTMVLFGNFYPDVPTPPNSYLLVGLVVLLLIGVGLGFYLQRIPDFFKRMLQCISDDGNDHPPPVMDLNNSVDSIGEAGDCKQVEPDEQQRYEKDDNHLPIN